MLPQLNKGVPVDRTGMAYVPDDPDEQDCMEGTVNVHAKPVYHLLLCDMFHWGNH